MPSLNVSLTEAAALRSASEPSPGFQLTVLGAELLALSPAPLPPSRSPSLPLSHRPSLPLDHSPRSPRPFFLPSVCDSIHVGVSWKWWWVFSEYKCIYLQYAFVF